MGGFIDLTGKTFGMLTVIKQNGRTSWGCSQWLCECSCGNTITVDLGRLHKGWTKSCGCYRKQLNTKHGVAVRNPKLYKTIQNHWEWCYVSERKQYKNYGGDGWYFSKEWLLPDGKPDYATIERFALANGWDDSDNTLIFEKDYLAEKLGVKEIGPQTVRFIHDRSENVQYSRRAVKVQGIPVAKIARFCGIQPDKSRRYTAIRDAVKRSPTITTLIDALAKKGVSKEKQDEVKRLFFLDGSVHHAAP